MIKQVLPTEDIHKKLIHYCNFQERCWQEVKGKLAQFNLTPEENNAILKYLSEHDLVNEERFAKSFTSSRARYKKWGRKKIAHELRLKGVHDALIERAWKTIDQGEYKKTLLSLIKIRLGKMSGKFTLKKRERIHHFLSSKGYENDLIQEVIQECLPLAT